MALSLQALAGTAGGKTIKQLGTLSGKEILILIDCGATHSFIREDLVESLSLPVDERVKFVVQVSDARNIEGKGICREVSLMVQGLEIKHTLYPFRLGGSDVILGADWLASLDEILVSWKRSTLKIDMGGEWICLQGDPTLEKSEMSCKALRRVLSGRRVGR